MLFGLKYVSFWWPLQAFSTQVHPTDLSKHGCCCCSQTKKVLLHPLLGFRFGRVGFGNFGPICSSFTTNAYVFAWHIWKDLQTRMCLVPGNDKRVCVWCLDTTNAYVFARLRGTSAYVCVECVKCVWNVCGLCLVRVYITANAYVFGFWTTNAYVFATKSLQKPNKRVCVW